MTTSTTRARVQALAREAAQAGTAYERAVNARDTAVARRSATLARLDEAVADAEAAVAEAIADTATKLGATAAATILGVGEADVRRAVRCAAEVPERS